MNGRLKLAARLLLSVVVLRGGWGKSEQSNPSTICVHKFVAAAAQSSRQRGRAMSAQRCRKRATQCRNVRFIMMARRDDGRQQRGGYVVYFKK